MVSTCCAADSICCSAAELSSTITFTNDYRFHGISQTAGDPAMQGSIDVAFDNGIYAGIWGSNVDFGDDANLEIDYYVGYGNNLTEDLSYAATLLYFQYPGYEAFDGDYAEIELQLFYKDFTLTYDYADDYFNLGEDGQYIAVDYSTAMTEQVSLDLYAGYSYGNYWDEFDIGDYSDYSVGISGSVAGLDLSAAYLFNDIDSANEIDSGVFRNDDTLLLSVSRTF
ncbi:MAG: TorF family putative porin [Amphritea sp.]